MKKVSTIDLILGVFNQYKNTPHLVWSKSRTMTMDQYLRRAGREEIALSPAPDHRLYRLNNIDCIQSVLLHQLIRCAAFAE
jgi:hypothetical protein